MTPLRVYLARINDCKSLEALSDVARGIEADRKMGGKDRIVLNISVDKRREYLASAVRA